MYYEASKDNLLFEAFLTFETFKYLKRLVPALIERILFMVNQFYDITHSVSMLHIVHKFDTTKD